jgi:uncharacterized damage-inducible protein DinB
MRTEYRKGAIGALMDEYERAAAELSALVERLSDAQYEAECDPHTDDPDCRSFQNIVSHVVRAGYGYASYIRSAFGMPAAPPERRVIAKREAPEAISAMLRHTAETLEGRWQMSDEEICAVVIESRWGPRYDLEQLLEHAIVHVLRHRRQIERLLHQNLGASA